MSEQKTKNDIAWETLFERHDILTKIDKRGVYEISSKEINLVREARLATKFDHSEQLPVIFKQNQLTIQPNARGTYLIGRFESYQSLSDDPSVIVEEAPFPTHIETINPANLYSESAVLLCAYHTGIISRLLNQDVHLTAFGRMSSGHFGYSIKNKQTGNLHEIRVEGAQLELDSGFEGDDVFAIFEAKNLSVDDFLVRQLYYPYRLWISRTSKRVVPVFLSYSNANSVFSFYVFHFTEDTQYNSIELVEHRKFQIVPSDIELADIFAALERTKIGPEPKGVPFPQADSFPRVIDLLTQLYDASGPLPQDTVTTTHGFDVRQTQYYTQAVAYLGLADRRYAKKQGVTYELTERGRSIMELHPKRRNLALVECLLERRVFNQTLKLYVTQKRPAIEQVMEIMKAARLNLSEETLHRRAQTVLLWADWAIKLTKQ